MMASIAVTESALSARRRASLPAPGASHADGARPHRGIRSVAAAWIDAPITREDVVARGVRGLLLAPSRSVAARRAPSRPVAAPRGRRAAPIPADPWLSFPWAAGVRQR